MGSWLACMRRRGGVHLQLGDVDERVVAAADVAERAVGYHADLRGDKEQCCKGACQEDLAFVSPVFVGCETYHHGVHLHAGDQIADLVDDLLPWAPIASARRAPPFPIAIPPLLRPLAAFLWGLRDLSCRRLLSLLDIGLNDLR